jgi:pimeloyl-ACP methyl ester carboxylesterase
MTTANHLVYPATRVRWAGLAGRELPGDTEPAFVLLHGLTFDHRMWGPILEALPEGRRAIAFDLPGHGASPMLADPGLAPVVRAIHAAVAEAGIERPVIVGHSIGGPLAAIYASEYPVAGVITIEAPIRLEGFAAGLREAEPFLRGAGFEQAWGQFRDSFGIGRVPAEHRPLLAVADDASQEVVLAYQADLLDRPLDDVVAWRDAGVARVAKAGTPYVALHATPQHPEEVRWMGERLPQAEIVVWPVGHHFPHLDRPDALVELMLEIGG